MREIGPQKGRRQCNGDTLEWCRPQDRNAGVIRGWEGKEQYPPQAAEGSN